MSSAAEELSPAGPPANAVSEVAQLPPPSEEESHAAIEKVWRFFCSLRLTLVNLLLLFLGMIAGTFVNPQNDSLANIERAFAGREWTLRAYRWLELYDLFHSWWFTGLLVSLALNLVACSLERLPRIWFLVRYPERRLDHVVGLRFKVPPTASDMGAPQIAEALRRRGFRVEFPQEGLVFAERGRYARFGVWVVHLSLLLILGGGVFGRLTAFEGIAHVPQNGGIISGFIQRNPDGSEFKHRLVDGDRGRPFLVQCNDFRLKEFEPGRPKAFESDLVVYEDLGSQERGNELSRATITVNHPLRYGGLTFYQASYSQLDEAQRAKIAIRDRATGETRPLMVAAAEPIQAAEGLTYQVVEYSADFAGLGPAVQVVRSEDGRRSTFWVFARDPGFDARNRPDRFSLSFERLAPLYATGLQIARDPSTPVVYLGCFLLFAGIGIAFYTSHKRVWAQAAAGKVALGGASHRNAEAFSREFGEIRQELFGDGCAGA
ncbi:MAG: cytochrome c biogenesis protein ResB [Myxococcales bacterium]